MEAYKSYCPGCKETYYWTGYKTGIGKTEEQLRQMKRDETVCKHCGCTELKTVLDHESQAGRDQDEMTFIVVDKLFGMLIGKSANNQSPPPPPPERVIDDG